VIIRELYGGAKKLKQLKEKHLCVGETAFSVQYPSCWPAHSGSYLFISQPCAAFGIDFNISTGQEAISEAGSAGCKELASSPGLATRTLKVKGR